jgi:hypothetical protein
MNTQEATLNLKNIFVSLNYDNECEEYNIIKNNFCGHKYLEWAEYIKADLKGNLVYIAGDLHEALRHPNIRDARISIIDNFVTKFDTYINHVKIHSSQVPLNVGGGVFVRNFFPQNNFADIESEHKFQNLTESNKPGCAYRKGIYLSEVTHFEEKTYFNLLRCSTNLDGPTEGFKDTDKQILEYINEHLSDYFDNFAPVNHVLAQIYYNASDSGKQKKGKISEHSDKTKDMPSEGVIAFATFYKGLDDVKKQNKIVSEDICDWANKRGVSVFTQMAFRNKTDETKNFSIKLYPNSLFVIPLSLNREFTHRIVPSPLDISDIPTRMGYVARCSNTKAVYFEGKTHIILDSDYIPLAPEKSETTKLIKKIYRDENLETFRVNYPFIEFSFNTGDYMKPQ